MNDLNMNTADFISACYSFENLVKFNKICSFRYAKGREFIFTSNYYLCSSSFGCLLAAVIAAYVVASFGAGLD